MFKIFGSEFTHQGIVLRTSKLVQPSLNEVLLKSKDLKSDIGWGHQIRSYVLDQSRIKDLRTGVESSNTQDVLDGNLDQFIEASLKSGL